MHAAPPTENIYIRTTRERAQAAKALAQAATDTGRNIQTERIRMAHTAADSITLRGIPAVGRSVSGAIHGTRPDSICNR